jgi:hypothetical protein
MAKGARTRGENMSNTDNMRVLAVVSTQLVHHTFIGDHDWSAQERALPPPEVAVDLLTHDRSS